MELWIRSQKKEMLYKVNSNLTIRYSNTINDAYFIELDDHKIAMYKTRERALEVLDEIQRKIAPITIIKQTKPIKYTDYNWTISDTTLYVENVSEVKEVGMVIYEMPKE